MTKIKAAFIKHGGITIGGSELWIQKIAANLPKDKFDIDFYYCDDSPQKGTSYTSSASKPERIEYLKSHGVNVIKFNVGARDINTFTHEWIDTDFWKVFDESKYELIQTVKAGPKEYPFYKMSKPVVEIVALANRPDTSKNIAWSFHSSNWQRAQWVRLGGSVAKSSVLTAPVEPPQSTENYRSELNIPEDAVIAGFHQRRDDSIASPIPLNAFKSIQDKYKEASKNWHFIIKNGGEFYRTQAKELGLTNIHFLGPTPDSASVSKFLNTIDVLAHGRKDGETFGAVFVEAMMHGKPCLSHYSIDGANAQPETMGPAGVFVMTQDEYTEVLYKYFSDDEFRQHLTDKAKPHAEAYYSMEKCIAEITEVYEKVSRKESNRNEIQYAVPYGYSDMGFLYAGDMNKTYNIAYHTLVGGIPEAFDVTIVQSLLPYTKSFYDIGANTGLYCWIASHYYNKEKIKGANVQIFEPQTDCVRDLVATRSLNNWEPLITIHPIGLGNVVENKTLHLSGTGSTFSQEFIGADMPTQSIKVDTLDNIIKAQSLISPDFIKIDVEGFEYAVLEGAKETISKNHPIIFIEIADEIKSRSYKNDRFKDTLKFIFDLGYRIYECNNNSIREINKDFSNRTIAMYLCFHDSHTKLIPVAEKAVKKYRDYYLLFGLVEKRLIKKVWNKIVPPYITPKKVINLIKRRLNV